jgi:hypothetical protein
VTAHCRPIDLVGSLQRLNQLAHQRVSILRLQPLALEEAPTHAHRRLLLLQIRRILMPPRHFAAHDFVAPATAATDTVIRMLIRVRRAEGLALASSLRQAISVTSARHDHDAVRVQIDPLHIG